MADVVITLNIMPQGVDVDLTSIESQAVDLIKDFSGMDNLKVTQEAVAFGLKALKIMFVMPEEKGGTDDLEQSIGNLEGVASAEVTDVRRTIG